MRLAGFLLTPQGQLWFIAGTQVSWVGGYLLEHKQFTGGNSTEDETSRTANH